MPRRAPRYGIIAKRQIGIATRQGRVPPSYPRSVSEKCTMPKYHLVSDVLFDFGFYDSEGMNWAYLLNIINGEWAEGNIKLLRSVPDRPEPEIWEPAQREVKITMTSGKRWIKCAVYQGPLKVIFEDPLLLEKDVLYVMGK